VSVSFENSGMNTKLSMRDKRTHTALVFPDFQGIMQLRPTDDYVLVCMYV